MIDAQPQVRPFIFRKKVKKISALALITAKILWRPKASQKFVLTQAYAQLRNYTAGGVADPPSIQIDVGTNGTDTVAAVDLIATVPGGVQRLAVVGNYYFDNDNPLRLRLTDVTDNAVYDFDLILVATKISDDMGSY